jgi:hypothetical protein
MVATANLAVIAGGSGGGSDEEIHWLALNDAEALELLNLIEFVGEDEEPLIRGIYLRLRAMAQPLRLAVDNTTH